MNKPAISQVRLLEKHADHIVVGILETSYRLHLLVDSPVQAEVGKRIRGTIRATAWKIDNTNRGGIYIEPIFGRPRRIQGRLVQIDTTHRRIVLSISGCLIECDLPDRFDPERYELGQLLAIELARGATFTEVAAEAVV